MYFPDLTENRPPCRDQALRYGVPLRTPGTQKHTQFQGHERMVLSAISTGTNLSEETMSQATAPNFFPGPGVSMLSAPYDTAGKLTEVCASYASGTLMSSSACDTAKKLPRMTGSHIVASSLSAAYDAAKKRQQLTLTRTNTRPCQPRIGATRAVESLHGEEENRLSLTKPGNGVLTEHSNLPVNAYQTAAIARHSGFATSLYEGRQRALPVCIWSLVGHVPHLAIGMTPAMTFNIDAKVMPLYQNQKQFLELRCHVMGDVTQSIYWPSCPQILCNGHNLKVKFAWSSFLLNAFVVEGHNYIDIRFPNMSVAPPTGLTFRLEQISLMEIPEAVQFVKHRSATDDSKRAWVDVSSNMPVWVPFLDPRTARQMEIPVRTVHCKHLECFDLETHCKAILNAEAAMCPICGIYADVSSLVLDDRVHTMLRHCAAASCTSSTPA